MQSKPLAEGVTGRVRTVAEQQVKEKRGKHEKPNRDYEF